MACDLFFHLVVEGKEIVGREADRDEQRPLPVTPDKRQNGPAEDGQEYEEMK